MVFTHSFELLEGTMDEVHKRGPSRMRRGRLQKLKRILDCIGLSYNKIICEKVNRTLVRPHHNQRKRVMVDRS
jgi:hypothetical protein